MRDIIVLRVRNHMIEYADRLTIVGNYFYSFFNCILFLLLSYKHPYEEKTISILFGYGCKCR